MEFYLGSIKPDLINYGVSNEDPMCFYTYPWMSFTLFSSAYFKIPQIKQKYIVQNAKAKSKTSHTLVIWFHICVILPNYTLDKEL